jgi:hypothetical protein
MKPHIESSGFGWILVDGKRFDHDIVIRLDGTVEKRKKKLSKVVFGSSHTLSLDEAKHVYTEGARQLVIGTGQSGILQLSDEAFQYYKKKGCDVSLAPTQEAITLWNESQGESIGLFHVTC